MTNVAVTRDPAQPMPWLWMDYIPLFPQIEAHAMVHGGLWVFRSPGPDGVDNRLRVEPSSRGDGQRVEGYGRWGDSLAFDLPVRGGRMVCDDLGCRPFWFQPGWTFRPVDSRGRPVLLRRTLGPWHSTPSPTESIGIVARSRPGVVSAFDGLAAQARVGHTTSGRWKLRHMDWQDAFATTASGALRAMDERFLREGYVLEGDVHASPFAPGYRAHPQGFARGR